MLVRFSYGNGGVVGREVVWMDVRKRKFSTFEMILRFAEIAIAEHCGMCCTLCQNRQSPLIQTAQPFYAGAKVLNVYT